MNQQQPPQSNRSIDSARDYVEQVQGDVYSGEVHIHQTPQPMPERPKIFHNLPQPDYGRFIGREPELAKVIRILRPYPHSQNAVITIDGIGGIGKSALALEIAHHFLRQFDELPEDERFEAIVWTSAKQNVLTAEGIRARRQVLHGLQDIYSAIAVTLQREDITRATTDEQDAVVTRALTQQRTLLIVDNLETVDDEAVLDFLRELPAPTKAIVTTRHRIDVAYPVRLSGMPWEDGRALIAQECEEKDVRLDEELTRQLYDRTGGVPLALVWSVAQMGFGYSPQAVLTRLGQPTNDITKFCFEGAVQRIKQTPAYSLLLTLSLCADSASREALGYATELPELDRDDGLVLLEKLSLVNKQGERFWLLPLTKGYAAAEFSHYPERERLREKWVEYFRTLSEEYSGEYWSWGNYDWLLAEGENILSIVDRALAVEDHKAAVAFVSATMRYLNAHGRKRELTSYSKKLSISAQKTNDKRILAWIYSRWLTAYYLFLHQDYDQAEMLARQGLALYQELNDVKGMGYALISLGRVCRKAGNFENAEKYYLEAVDTANTHRYGDGVAFVHFELAKLARDRNDWALAKRYWTAFITWYEEHIEDTDLGALSYMMATGNLGWVEFNLGNIQQGKNLIERSVLLIERIGGRGYYTIFHRRLAAIDKALGNIEEASQHLQKAIYWAKQLGLRQELHEAQALLQELNAEAAEPQNQEQTP